MNLERSMDNRGLIKKGTFNPLQKIDNFFFFNSRIRLKDMHIPDNEMKLKRHKKKEKKRKRERENTSYESKIFLKFKKYIGFLSMRLKNFQFYGTFQFSQCWI